MKALKKIVIGIVCAAVMMSSAATALADETTAASQPSGTEESTTSTFDISNMSFDTMYGNQVMDFLNHQYYYNGQKIPLAESDYYFLLTFLQLSQYAAYGYYPSTSAGYIDLAAHMVTTARHMQSITSIRQSSICRAHTSSLHVQRLPASSSKPRIRKRSNRR